MSKKEDQSSVKKGRVKLNRDFIKLKEGQSIICKLEGYGLKQWEEFDEASGELKPKSSRTLHFINDKGIPFQMFENGGLKSISDALIVGKWVELESEGVEDFTMDDGTPGRVNKYSVYEAPVPALAIA